MAIREGETERKRVVDGGKGTCVTEKLSEFLNSCQTRFVEE